MQRQRKDAWREGRSSSAAGARRRPARGDAAPRLVEVVLEDGERGKRDAEQVPRAPEGARRRRLLRELAVGPEERRGRPLGVGLEARAEQVPVLGLAQHVGADHGLDVVGGRGIVRRRVLPVVARRLGLGAVVVVVLATHSRGSPDETDFERWTGD